MGEFDDEDFDDLYADVEVQVSSPINAIQALTQLPRENEETYNNAVENCDFPVDERGDNAEETEERVEKEKEEEGEREENDSGKGNERESEGDNEGDSDSEDDPNIALNDDGDNNKINSNEKWGGKAGFQRGRKGPGVNDENEWKSGVEYNGSLGERAIGGKECCADGSYTLQNKHTRSQSAAFSSNLKSQGSVGVAPVSSPLVRGEWEDDDFAHQLGTWSIGVHRGHNFSHPCSRTILDVNIDALEHKPWRRPGVDMTDIFNSSLDENSWKHYCNHLPKGRAIQVEDSIGERPLSTDIKQCVERDSDVIIHIPVQDIDAEHSNSDKCPHEASGSGNVVSVDAGDMLCFRSASEDDLPILEGSTEGTGKSVPKRCFRHTSPCDCDPVDMDLDNYGSIQGSDADDQLHQLTDGHLDGTAEAIRASDGTTKGVGRVKLTTSPSTEKPESSESEQSQHSPSSSPARIGYVASRGGAYAMPDEFLDHSKRPSPNSVSELRESVTFDYHSSKDTRSHSINMRSGNYEYFARSKSPVQRNLKFQNKTSGRKSGLKSRLDDEGVSLVSEAEKFCDVRHSCHKQRDREHALDSYEEKDFSYYEESEHSFSCGRARFSDYQTGSAGYLHGKGQRTFGYEEDKCNSQNLTGKHHFCEQRMPRLNDEAMEWNCHHYVRGLSVPGMDSLNYDGSRKNAEQSPFLDIRNCSQWKRKADEPHFKRRMRNGDFSPQHNYCNELPRDKYRSIPYSERERDSIGNRYHRPLPYARRDVRSHVRGKRRYGSPFNSCDTIWHKEPRSASRGRGRGRAGPLSRNGIHERHGRRRRQHYVERFRGSNRLDCYADAFDNDENVKCPDDEDDFVRGGQHRQSELFHWAEDYSSRNLEDNFQDRGTPYPFESTSRNKRFDAKSSSVHGRKLLDGRGPNQRRYKLSREGDSCSQFVRSSNNFHKENFDQTRPRCWDSTDSHIFVGERKSSRCFEDGNLFYHGRYKYLDWNDDPELIIFNDLNESRLEKVVEADGTKISVCRDDANWCEKFSDAELNDSLDIEEGQVVTDDLNEKPRENAIASDV